MVKYPNKEILKLAENIPEIISTRLFNSPRKRLWQAFAVPKQLAQWWGPKGFTNTIHQFDLKPGGLWVFTMHSPGGANYENESRFVEIRKPERIVFDHLGPVHGFQMAMTFEEESGKTRLTWRMRFDSLEEYTKMKSFIPTANEENFDRLEKYLSGAW